MSVVPQGRSVQSLYSDFREGNLLVNRRYQRKLVWSIEEKQQLIDSILEGFPIPLILLAERPDVHGSGKFEIIDGIQRLNAIFTYIENDFDFAGKYFDVSQFTSAKLAAQEGKFTAAKDQPALDPKTCARLLNYQLAVTIYPSTSEGAITDVFSRINSGGRQLSPQEQRQAGILSDFAQLVRRLGSEIRGDVSAEVLRLSQMPEISVDSTRGPHGYGVIAEETFWCQQGVLSVKQLKESEDEQMLADIVASILKGDPIPASKELFDRIYDPTSADGQECIELLAAYGSDRLSSEMKAVFSVLRSMIESQGNQPKLLRSTVRPGTSYPIKAPFFSIFMALFDLVVRQSRMPDQPAQILESLHGLDERLAKGAHYETTENRKSNINLTKGLIQDFFVNRVPPSLTHGPSLLLDFENAVRRSRIETPRYEFKQGILRLDTSRCVDKQLLDRLVQTAGAIANVGPDADGFIFIGVANDEDDARRIEMLDSVVPDKLAEHYIVGVDREVSILSVDLERYVQKIVQTFRKADITEPLKTQLLSSFDTVDVKGKSVLRIRVPRQGDVSFVDGKAFYREDSNTIEIQGPQLLAISRLFRKS